MVGNMPDVAVVTTKYACNAMANSILGGSVLRMKKQTDWYKWPRIRGGRDATIARLWLSSRKAATT